jgi:hypothetical protein
MERIMWMNMSTINGIIKILLLILNVKVKVFPYYYTILLAPLRTAEMS